MNKLSGMMHQTAENLFNILKKKGMKLSANEDKLFINSTIMSHHRKESLYQPFKADDKKETDSFLEIVQKAEKQEGYNLSSNEFSDLLEKIPYENRLKGNEFQLFASVDKYVMDKKATMVSSLKKRHEGVYTYAQEEKEKNVIFDVQKQKPKYVPPIDPKSIQGMDEVEKTISIQLKSLDDYSERISIVQREASLAVEKIDKKIEELMQQKTKTKMPFDKKQQTLFEKITDIKKTLTALAVTNIPLGIIQKWNDMLLAHVSIDKEIAPEKIKEPELKAKLIEKFGEKMKSAIELAEKEIIADQKKTEEYLALFPQTQQMMKASFGLFKGAGVFEKISEFFDGLISKVKSWLGFWENAGTEIDQIDAELSDVESTEEVIPAEASLNKKSEKVWVVYDEQTGRYMETGYGVKTIEEAIEALIDYISVDTEQDDLGEIKNMPLEEQKEFFEGMEFEFQQIDESELKIEANLNKEAKIVEENGKYKVVSESGKNLGVSDTKADAEKRLKEVEFFKHQKKGELNKEAEAEIENEMTYDEARQIVFNHYDVTNMTDEKIDEVARHIMLDWNTNPAHQKTAGFSTTPMDVSKALRISKGWEVVSASQEAYFNNRSWARNIESADIKEDDNTIFFNLKGGEFVEVERPINERSLIDQSTGQVIKAEIEDENQAEEFNEPEPYDYIIYDERGKTSVAGGPGDKFIGEFNDYDEAEQAIIKDMKESSITTNVWMQSDHGNNHLVTDFPYPKIASQQKSLPANHMDDLNLNKSYGVEKKADHGYPNDVDKCRSCLWLNSDCTIDGGTSGFFGRCATCVHAYDEKEIKAMDKDDKSEIIDRFESRAGVTNPTNIQTWETRMANLNKQASSFYIDYAGGKFEGWAYDPDGGTLTKSSNSGYELENWAKKNGYTKIVWTNEAKSFKEANLNIRTDYYQKGFDNAVYGFAYIPDFNTKEDEAEYVRGYKDGKASLLNKKADSKEEMHEVGKKIEYEHAPTYKKIKEKIDDGKLDMTLDDVADSIATDHENEFKNYYDKNKGLPNMEKELKKKESSIRLSNKDNIKTADQEMGMSQYDNPIIEIDKETMAAFNNAKTITEFDNYLESKELDESEKGDIVNALHDRYPDQWQSKLASIKIAEFGNVEQAIEYLRGYRIFIDQIEGEKDKYVVEDESSTNAPMEEMTSEEIIERANEKEFDKESGKPDSGEAMDRAYDKYKDAGFDGGMESTFADAYNILRDYFGMGINIGLDPENKIIWIQNKWRKEENFPENVQTALNIIRGYGFTIEHAEPDASGKPYTAILKKKADSGTSHPLYEVECPADCDGKIEVTPADLILSPRVSCPKCGKTFQPKKFEPKSLKHHVFKNEIEFNIDEKTGLSKPEKKEKKKEKK